MPQFHLTITDRAGGVLVDMKNDPDWVNGRPVGDPSKWTQGQVLAFKIARLLKSEVAEERRPIEVSDVDA